MTSFTYWYAYPCCDSSETRGFRPSHTGGCGHWNPRGTKEEITEENKPQGSPCKGCNRRQRINPGIVVESPQSRIYPNGKMYPLSPSEKKQWASDFCEERNNATRLRNEPNTTGRSETNEAGGETFDA